MDFFLGVVVGGGGGEWGGGVVEALINYSWLITLFVNGPFSGWRWSYKYRY